MALRTTLLLPSYPDVCQPPLTISANTLPLVSIGTWSRLTDLRHASRGEPQSHRTDMYHIDKVLLGRATLVVLGDLRMCDSQEEAISGSLRSQKINNAIVFGYLACAASTNTSALSSTLSTIVSPPIKDIDNLAHSRYFSMTEACVRFVLGQDYNEFCRFLRGQDDFFARKLMDYAIVGKYHQDELYKHNFKFLQWEIDARESI
jgi:hypothetical protein